MHIPHSLSALAWLALGLLPPAPAQATAITSATAFAAALPGPQGVLDFDALAGGGLLAGAAHAVSGGPAVSISFPVVATDFLGTSVHFQVADDVGHSNPTTSGAHSLGTDDAGNFNLITAGTRFTMELSGNVNAFGLSMVTPDAMFDDDIRLMAGAEVAALKVSDRTTLGVFGGATYYAYFLGIVRDTGFGSVSIDYGPAVSGGPFLYNIDDIRVAVAADLPEPGTLALVLAGIAAAVLRPRKR